jgi:hypothetical protein
MSILPRYAGELIAALQTSLSLSLYRPMAAQAHRMPSLQATHQRRGQTILLPVLLLRYKVQFLPHHCQQGDGETHLREVLYRQPADHYPGGVILTILLLL